MINSVHQISIETPPIILRKGETEQSSPKLDIKGSLWTVSLHFPTQPLPTPDMFCSCFNHTEWIVHYTFHGNFQLLWIYYYSFLCVEDPPHHCSFHSFLFILMTHFRKHLPSKNLPNFHDGWNVSVFHSRVPFVYKLS